MLYKTLALIDWHAASIALIAFVVSAMIVVLARYIPLLSGGQSSLSAVQAMHIKLTPRLGGLAIFAALLAGLPFTPPTITDRYTLFIPIFPMWCSAGREYRLNLRGGRAFFASTGATGRAGCWNWADQTGKPRRSGLTAVFFSAADTPVLHLSFSLGVDRPHAHDGGARRRRIAARMARTIWPVTASWKMMVRA